VEEDRPRAADCGFQITGSKCGPTPGLAARQQRAMPFPPAATGPGMPQECCSSQIFRGHFSAGAKAELGWSTRHSPRAPKEGPGGHNTPHSPICALQNSKPKRS